MNWNEVLPIVLQSAIIFILGTVAFIINKFVGVKRDELLEKCQNDRGDKYISMLADSIIKSVLAIKQTYVDDLKKQGKFDLAAQQHAAQTALDAVMNSLSQDAILYLNEMYGDLEEYIKNSIEATVIQNK